MQVEAIFFFNKLTDISLESPTVCDGVAVWCIF